MACQKYIFGDHDRAIQASPLFQSVRICSSKDSSTPIGSDTFFPVIGCSFFLPDQHNKGTGMSP